MDEASDARTPFEQIGGEPIVRALVDDFYDRMDRQPEVATLRALHPPNLRGSREKLFLFLCGWLGGPQYFVEKYGHPRLRARHMPFSIGVVERDQWMACMRAALAVHVADDELRAALDGAFDRLADHMRNRVDPP